MNRSDKIRARLDEPMELQVGSVAKLSWEDMRDLRYLLQKEDSLLAKIGQLEKELSVYRTAQERERVILSCDGCLYEPHMPSHVKCCGCARMYTDRYTPEAAESALKTKSTGGN